MILKFQGVYFNCAKGSLLLHARKCDSLPCSVSGDSVLYRVVPCLKQEEVQQTCLYRMCHCSNTFVDCSCPWQFTCVIRHHYQQFLPLHCYWNVINIIGQIAPLIVGAVVSEEWETFSISLVARYIALILLDLSLIPTLILVIIYFRPIRM